MLHDRLDTMDKQWMHLVKELPNNEAQLHTAQMELLPSRQALNELMLWLQQMEGVLREDEGKELSALLEVQVMLHKYKASVHNMVDFNMVSPIVLPVRVAPVKPC